MARLYGVLHVCYCLSIWRSIDPARGKSVLSASGALRLVTASAEQALLVTQFYTDFFPLLPNNSFSGEEHFG
jgi:hypothetical protein